MENDTLVRNLMGDMDQTKTEHRGDTVINLSSIESMIITLRGLQVIIDRDLARLYGVETKVLNQAVRRNLDRFPPRFRFQLTKEEADWVVTNCDHLLNIKYLPASPYCFTEQGVAMLSTVLRSKTAISVSIQIMDAFTAMRHVIASSVHVFQRLETLEHHQLEFLRHQSLTDRQIEEIFKRLDQDYIIPKQGIFYQGQIFDAYSFASDLIKSAKRCIILIDNYIDESVLLMLAKRNADVSAKIITKTISATLNLDLERHNQQYPPIDVEQSGAYHDRFLIIDDTVYHIGASLKDLGKKLFAFSKLNMPVERVVIQ